MMIGFENVSMLLFKTVGLSSSYKFIYCCFCWCSCRCFCS